MQFLLKVEQFLAFTLQHTVHGYACPAGHHLGYVIGGNLLLDEGVVTLPGV